jgi:hypothetical protein
VRSFTDYEPPSTCHFGIISGALAGGLLELGVGAATADILGGIGGSLLTGIGGSEILAGITGGDPIKALESGAISGGIGGIAGAALGPAGVGLSSTVAQGIGGALGGGVSAFATGSNPITGALTGGATGALSGAFGGGSTTTPSTTVASAPATGGAAASAASTSGLSVGGGAPVDLPASLSGGGGINVAAGATGGVSGGGNVDFTGGGDFGGTGIITPQTPNSTGGLSGMGSNILGFFEKNPGALIAGGLLGANMLMGDKPLPAETAIQQNAGEAQSHANVLQAYQTSGTLPPGLQSLVDQQTSAAEAELRSSFAKNGMSGTTMEAEQLGQLKRAKAGQIAALADNLAKQGIAWAGLSAQEMGQLLSAQQAQDTAFTQSLGLFAGGLSGLRGSGTGTA